MGHHLKHRICLQGRPEMEVRGQRVMLVVDSKPGGVKEPKNKGRKRHQARNHPRESL